MTTSPQIAPDSRDVAGGERCAVCEHELAGHDPISLRYCHATQAQAHSRACICPPHPNPDRPDRTFALTGAAGVNHGAE